MSGRPKYDLMRGVECTKSKIVANNTVEYFKPTGERVIRLHEIDILTFDPDGTITFDSGGWKTVTTKDRMNAFQNQVHIMQHNSIWYVQVPDSGWNLEGATPYFDGMKIKTHKITNRLDGDPIGETKKLIKKINAYCKEIRDMRVLPEPSNKDCWYCLFKTQDGKPAFSGKEHLINHLDEKYVHGSLIRNALMSAGYKDPGFIFQYAQCTNNRDSITRAVKQYFKQELGIPR